MLALAAACVAVVALPGCGGNRATEDLLAPVPTKVDPRDVEPTPLVELWKLEPEGDPDDEDAPPLPSVPGALGAAHAFVARGSELLALDIADGRLAWTLELGSPAIAPLLSIGESVAAPTASAWLLAGPRGRLQGVVPVATPPLAAVALEGGLVQVDGQTVRRLRLYPAEQSGEVWALDVPGASAVAIDESARTAVVTTSEGPIVGVNLANGRRLWENREIEALPLRPTIAGSEAIVVGVDSRLRAIRLSNGKRRWTSKDIGVQVAAAPAVLDGVVWAAGLDSALHAYQPGGSHLFRLPLAGRVFIDLVTWDRWVFVSPQYGPWSIVRAPLRRMGPADPGQPRGLALVADGDLDLSPAVGPAGVLAIDATGVIRLFGHNAPARPVPQPTPREN
jgi:outer membrane protein assembly factor BamB